ncbi:dynein regulatory complex subunit 3 [Eurytemora carolleeae]|uniref:dynein regulatory complex subunit 3 n=1 Tax=Eurytemora carolleeae TaxID=1294199 RepID=UPI000C7949E4|nr:dynein regulatory complex subunit 3 [Eurytemora carolleeae]|eukprot:XP_023337840.1 dynein regulatory complex subunit 3-like [Eurytemora affinis]
MQKNIKVLAIFNNSIEQIENLHHMTKLEVLRLGNNKISDRESILYMRKLQNLKTLSLKGNPITNMKDFEGFVAAFLPGLVYFEFKMVNSRTRRIFTELFQGELFKVQGKEENEESKAKLQKEEKELKEREKKAFVDKLRGIDLLNSMFTEHLTEEEKVGEVQKALECQEKFKNDFLVILSKLYNLGLQELEEREIEWKRIDEGIDLAKLELEKDSLQTIQIFSEVKQDMLDRMIELGDQLLDLDPDSISELQVQEVETYREEYRMKCKELNKNLLKHEVILINSIESMIEAYEQKLGSMTARFLNSCGGFLQEARDLETLYFQYLLELVDTFGGIRTDTLLSLVALCHDAHQKVLDRRQEGLRLAVNTWREDHFRHIRETEFNRSRSRVLEISQYVDCVRQELEDIEVLPQAECVETEE